MHEKQLEIYGTALQKKELQFSYFLDYENEEKTEDFDGKLFRYSVVPKNGQRKLLLTEIFFLTQNPKGLVVYVGSAPGHHIRLLLRLFPDLKFHLYDPREHVIKESERVKIFQQFFTDVDAYKYDKTSEDTDISENDDIIFISDIRTMEGYENDEEKLNNQNLVEEDENMEMNWVKIIKPKAYSLKFKLNWTKETQEYLDGQLFLESWVNIYSMECRLLGSGFDTKEYNCSEYERRMCFYNLRERFEKYAKDPKNVYNTKQCQCHDCMSEMNVINEYVNKKITNISIDKLMEEIDKIKEQ